MKRQRTSERMLQRFVHFPLHDSDDAKPVSRDDCECGFPVRMRYNYI
jgi:hypothetical protein